MKISAVVLVATLAAGGLVGATNAQPPSAVMAPVRAMLAITEGKSALDIDSLFTADPVVIDEGAPFLFTGAHAASRWWSGVRRTLTRMHVGSLTVTPGAPVEFVQRAGSAYLILPVTLRGAGPKPLHESGMLTFTLQQVGSHWKISSQVWTTVETVAPVTVPTGATALPNR